jgi:hypothetical protein
MGVSLVIVSNDHRALTTESLGRSHKSNEERAYSRPPQEKPGECAMVTRIADISDRTATQLQSSDERLVASAELERLSDFYISTSRQAINESQHLLANIRIRSGVPS